jgi:hypothetical protein
MKAKDLEKEKNKYGLYFEFSKLMAFGKRLAWVAKARETDIETRYSLQLIMVDKKSIACTDGRRLHILDYGKYKDQLSENFVPGHYTVITETAKTIGIAQYMEAITKPLNWQKVVPEGKPPFSMYFDSPRIEKTIKWKGFDGLNYMQFMFSLPEKLNINFRYLSDLMPDESYEVDFYGKSKGVVFKLEDTKAVIMPMCLE